MSLEFVKAAMPDIFRAEGKLLSLCTTACGKAIAAGSEAAQRNHKWVSRSGQAASELRTMRVESSALSGSWVVSGANLMRLHFGTAAHDIMPKASGGFMGPVRRHQGRRAEDDIGTHRVALRFVVNGQTRFATKVHHPGTQPDPWLDNAADVTRDTLFLEVERAISEVFG